MRALERLRLIRSDRREAAGKVQLAIQEGERSGMLVADVDGVSFAYGERPIVRDFSTSIMRGDKVGIIGPNGAGKTTLLRILLGQLQPQAGSVRLGTNLQVAYFDQLRQQLNDEASVQDNVADGYDTVHVGGGSRHVIGYLRDFLFSPERARLPVKFLSGGERNRLLLAKLFTKPANVIVLDEPTNDLDTETLELLEERLVEFEGTVLLVSHDRAFLNNVVTSTIVFEEAGFASTSAATTIGSGSGSPCPPCQGSVRRRTPAGCKGRQRDRPGRAGGSPSRNGKSWTPCRSRLKRTRGGHVGTAWQMAVPEFYQQTAGRDRRRAGPSQTARRPIGGRLSSLGAVGTASLVNDYRGFARSRKTMIEGLPTGRNGR